jgi:Raf kinase inhibitor-like YbhB/YbcL family protein
MLSVQRCALPTSLCLLAAIAAPDAAAQTAPMVLASPDFSNDGFLPLSAINNITYNNANICTVSGATGGDQSPPLVWADVPPGTRTLALVLFDATASFTHWGIYDIPGRTRELPANAGAPGASPYGTQILDDGNVTGYYGPCPPPDYPPNRHRYVFTLYALGTRLRPAGSANYPTNAESLFQALIAAGAASQILATATLTGLYTNTPH